MLRPLLSAARCVARPQLVSCAPLCRHARQLHAAQRTRLAYPVQKKLTVRWYSSGGGMAKPEVEGRIMDLLKGFDKVKDASKLAPTSHFSNDLGLDSLDTVEVVMAIEEEFSIEIPDKEADAIQSINDAVEYILKQPDAH